jgi:hypothetical protein
MKLVLLPRPHHALEHVWLRNFDATADFFERTLIKGEPIPSTPEEH